MIKAKHNRLITLFFDHYIDRILKKDFSRFYQVNPFPCIDNKRPLMIIPNHISWWDGFFIYSFLRRNCGKKLHLMMLEEQLRQFRFFKGLGAFSIVPGERSSVMETMVYMIELFKSPQNAIILYPQGEIRPYWKRPCGLKNGWTALFGEKGIFARLMKKAILPILIPAGFCIHYYNERHPEIWLRFGKTIEEPENLRSIEHISRHFHENLAALDLAVEERQFEKELFKFF